MSEKDHNLRLAGVLAVAALAILLAMCSCVTKRVTEYVTEHDTLRLFSTDTLREIKIQVRSDTVKQIEWHEITLNEGGDTVKVINNYYQTEKTIVVDSTDRYQAKVDSLQSVIDKMHEKEVVKEKKRPWWRWVVALSCVAVAAAGIWLMRRFKIE